MDDKAYEKDELLGFWENDADDASGLHAIWGYAIEFLEDGTGFHHNWGRHVREEDKKAKISWKRTAKNAISIKFELEEEWDKIEYDIAIYDNVWLKLTELDKEEFWSAPDPIYKRIG